MQFIIITNSKGIIQTHPSDSKIGIKSNCKDIDKVLKDKKSIISEWNNEFGNFLVAFEPIYKENKFLGVACVGISINDLKNELSDFLIKILPVFIITIVLAVIGSELIARNIKKSIFGLEPNEIALLLKQKELIINNIYDGLIAVNEFWDITLINDRAKAILKIEKESEVYFKIKELLMEVLSKKKNITNLEMRLPMGITIMSNFSSILDEKDNLLGAIVTFQDLTIVTQMAEELTGVKELTWDLRAQNHEFLNKLQIIAGLIQLDEADKALEYIFHTVEVQDDLIKILRKIDNTSL
ncbi:sensor histidine kinase regulating citrate/malate metabolism [Clostridium moniliforme]|uniref:Sensor histidine kinase regulating citrate/malate metabolism n=1 Tax=Clostridium moniliforme TaxID=39489 RepID=A0ABS4F1G4_9CLOT|nr:sensor histidine kinase regulating citrate/malate metabolism [Clostridium moniliforme]